MVLRLAWILGCSLPLKSGTFCLEYLNTDVRTEQVWVFQVLEVGFFFVKCVKNWDIFRHAVLSAITRVRQPTYLRSGKGAGDRKEGKGKIPPARCISSFQNIPEEGNSHIYPRAHRVEKVNPILHATGHTFSFLPQNTWRNLGLLCCTMRPEHDHVPQRKIKYFHAQLWVAGYCCTLSFPWSMQTKSDQQEGLILRVDCLL